MPNKTISELPNFTGDTSMRFHVHKPGQSESLSINDVASLVSTGGSLQTGDIVLRPAGYYPDAIECDGAVYDKNFAPILAAKLNNYAESGVTPSGINANSEIRFGGTATFGIVYKIKDFVLVKSASGSNVSFYSGRALVSNRSEHSISRLAKTSRALYSCGKTGTYNNYIFKYNDLFTRVQAYYMYSNGGDGVALIGVADYYGEFDIIVAQEITGFKFIKTSVTNVSSNEIIHEVPTSYSIKQFVKVGSKYFAIATVDGVSGLYELIISDDTLEFNLHIEGYTKILEGQSSYVYAIKGSVIYQVSPDTRQELVISNTGLSYNYKHYNDSVFIYTISSGSYISFDRMRTWVKGPTMSAYQDCDYDNGEFVFVGGTGSTGSVNGQSGAIQVNAASFDGDMFFKVPNLSSMTPNFKQYILK